MKNQSGDFVFGFLLHNIRNFDRRMADVQIGLFQFF